MRLYFLAIAIGVMLVMALTDPVGGIGFSGHLSSGQSAHALYADSTGKTGITVNDSSVTTAKIQNAAVTTAKLAPGLLNALMFGAPLSASGADSIWMNAKFRWWPTFAVPADIFGTSWCAWQTDSTHSGPAIYEGVGGHLNGPQLTIFSGNGYVPGTAIDIGIPGLRVEAERHVGSRAIYARQTQNASDSSWAIYARNDRTATGFYGAIYGVQSGSNGYGLCIASGKVYLPANSLAYSYLSAAAQDSMHTHCALADTTKAARAKSITAAMTADSTLTMAKVARHTFTDDRNFAAHAISSRALGTGLTLSGGLNVNGSLYITGSGDTLFIGDSVYVDLPTGFLQYDELSDAAQDSMHTWAYDAEDAVYAWLAFDVVPGNIDWADLAGAVQDSINARPDSVYKAHFADGATTATSAASAQTAGYADTSRASGTATAVVTHGVGFAALSTGCKDSLASVYRGSLVPNTADSARVAASAYAADYADSAAKAGWAAIGADTVGYADTSLVAATAYALKPLGLGWAAFSAACKDSLKTRVHPDSSLKAAKADSAGKVATTFKPTTAVLADTSIAVRGNAVGHATTADSSGKVAATFKPTTAALSDSTKKVGDGSIGTTQIATGGVATADIAAGAVTGPILSGYLRMRAGQDTTRLLNLKAQCLGTHAGDTTIVNLKGQGYTYLWDFAIAGHDSLTRLTVRVDGATVCSLQVRDFCGFPGLKLTNDSINVFGHAAQHAIGAIKSVSRDDGDNGQMGLEAFHRIPFADSLKVVVTGTVSTVWLDMYYHLASITDWGRYRHWHATAVSDSGTAAKYLFDSGTITGGGAYLGTAIHFKYPDESYMERLIWFKYDNADSLPGNSTEGHFGGAYFYGGPYIPLVNHVNDVRFTDGVYLLNLHDTPGQVGAYRWYTDLPLCFNTRFGLRSATGATGKWHAVSFWYSAN